MLMALMKKVHNMLDQMVNFSREKVLRKNQIKMLEIKTQ